VEKLVYVLWKRAADADAGFVASLRDDVAKRMLDLEPPALSMNLVDETARSVQQARLTRLDPPPSGTLSLWLDAAEDRVPYEELLAGVTDRRAGYLVVESVPLRNTSHPAPLGERTPGVNMVALLERPERLGWEAWIDYWHGTHRQVALETQCTFRYVRNVVVRPLTEGAPPWEGIVEEGFPTEAVTDPMLWYGADGSKEKLRANLSRMVESCRQFLDLDRVESHPMSEYAMAELESGRRPGGET
jgi:hypothetical protein